MLSKPQTLSISLPWCADCCGDRSHEINQLQQTDLVRKIKANTCPTQERLVHKNIFHFNIFVVIYFSRGYVYWPCCSGKWRGQPGWQERVLLVSRRSPAWGRWSAFLWSWRTVDKSDASLPSWVISPSWLLQKSIWPILMWGFFMADKTDELQSLFVSKLVAMVATWHHQDGILFLEDWLILHWCVETTHSLSF